MEELGQRIGLETIQEQEWRERRERNRLRAVIAMATNGTFDVLLQAAAISKTNHVSIDVETFDRIRYLLKHYTKMDPET
jgi:hypothetical protein